jgi:hypothetical protein
MVAMTNVMSLAFSARSRLKMPSKFMSFGNGFYFERLSSVALCKYISSDQATTCQPNPMLRNIPGSRFSQSSS